MVKLTPIFADQDQVIGSHVPVVDGCMKTVVDVTVDSDVFVPILLRSSRVIICFGICVFVLHLLHTWTHIFIL